MLYLFKANNCCKAPFWGFTRFKRNFFSTLKKAIFELASGGFESTVRLAKSNAAMWVPIFMQNKENVLDVLNEHISQLRKFKACLEKENGEFLTELIGNANTISGILN